MRREVPLRTVIATTLWLIGITLGVFDFLDWAEVGDLGVIVAAVGATLNVRGFFLDLFERECRAFEAGREYERFKLVR
jgi:hypothetical protein